MHLSGKSKPITKHSTMLQDSTKHVLILVERVLTAYN